MSKPIAIVYFPENISMGNDDVNYGEITAGLNKTYPDYYWFCVPDNNAEKIYLQVFYEKDFTEIQYQELRKLIEKSLQPTENQTKTEPQY